MAELTVPKDCFLNEHCRRGVCLCNANYVFNSVGICVYFENAKKSISSDEKLEKTKLTTVLSKKPETNNSSHTKLKTILKWSISIFVALCCIVCFILFVYCKNKNTETSRENFELEKRQNPLLNHSGNVSN